jgi:hypothetical protein
VRPLPDDFRVRDLLVPSGGRPVVWPQTIVYDRTMANRSSKKAKPTTKTLREEDVITTPQRRPVGKPGVPTHTGVRAGAKNANNGEGWTPPQ